MTLPSPETWPVEDPIFEEESRDILRERATATPDATAIVVGDGGRTWSYDAFDRRVDRWSGGLVRAVDIDLSASRVGLCLPTGIAFATAYFAITRRNGTAVPLNVRESTGTIGKQATRAGIDAVLCSAETESMARTVSPPGTTVLAVDEAATSETTALEPVSEPDRTALQAGPDTERLVLFTSGTTGEPKGVRLTRGNLLASAVGSAQRLGVASGDRWLVCLPMYHMGGLAPLVRSTLYGTTAVLQREFDAGETATLLDEQGISGVSLVPTMLRRLLDDGWTPSDSLRFVLLGGAPARPPLIERCDSAGVPVSPTYGTTETASQITTATPMEAFEQPETVGRPLRHTSVTVLAGGRSCEPDEGDEPGDVGELVVAGPTVTPGYLDREQTAAAFDDWGFHTGDVGYRDDAGRYYVVGRVDNQIVTGGENVQPASVARTIESVPGVEAAAVVGLPDEEWGQRVTAAVVPATEALTAETVRKRAREQLADFAVPKRIELLESLPRTASGTIDRERVRALLSGDDSD